MAVIETEIRTEDQTFVDAAYRFAEDIDLIVTSISDSEVCGVLTKDLKYHRFSRAEVLKTLEDIHLEEYEVRFITTLNIRANSEEDALAKASEQIKSKGLDPGLLYAYVNGHCKN